MQNNKSNDLDAYQANLDAFIKINNLITEHSQWGKSLTERETLSSSRESSRQSFVTLEDKVIGYINSVENTERSKVGLDTERRCNCIEKELNLKERENNLELKEKSLTALANKLMEKEKKLTSLEKKLKMKESTLSAKEMQIKEEMSKLSQSKSLPSHLNCSLIPLLNFENTEVTSFTPPYSVKPEIQLPQNIQVPNLEEYITIIRELEAMNSDMINRNESLQGEISHLQAELHHQRSFIIKEAEKLSDKENSLIFREQTLATRESKLMERTKFMNSTLKSVNQYIKSTSSDQEFPENRVPSPIKQPDYTTEDLTFKGFLRNLHEIKDFSNRDENH